MFLNSSFKVPTNYNELKTSFSSTEIRYFPKKKELKSWRTNVYPIENLKYLFPIETILFITMMFDQTALMVLANMGK